MIHDTQLSCYVSNVPIGAELSGFSRLDNMLHGDLKSVFLELGLLLGIRMCVYYLFVSVCVCGRQPNSGIDWRARVAAVEPAAASLRKTRLSRLL